ncbi:MAG: hypothetical protein WC319_05370 [Candidatus Paceibacterota bacterium]|jgi:hypothetical protein
MRVDRYNEMMIGLIQTAIEKQCVLGDDAKEDIEKIKEIMEDLQMFWNSDELLTFSDWVKKLETELERINYK